jgi:hypothetical protein
MTRVLIAALFLSACTLENLGESASSGGANSDATRVFETPKSTSNVLVVTGVWEAAKPETSGPLTSTARFEFRDSFAVARGASPTRGDDVAFWLPSDATYRHPLRQLVSVPP